MIFDLFPRPTGLGHRSQWKGLYLGPSAIQNLLPYLLKRRNGVVVQDPSSSLASCLTLCTPKGSVSSLYYMLPCRAQCNLVCFKLMIVTFLSDVEILEIVWTRNPPMPWNSFLSRWLRSKLWWCYCCYLEGGKKNLRRRNFQYARSSVFEESGKSWDQLMTRIESNVWEEEEDRYKKENWVI